ncbi:MAG: hypothetical protein HY738_14000, partial [Bacteroidia bacterium]|nr:hypothetical protein [Bacteroidia bacterium]
MNKKQRAFIILLDILVVFISFIIFIWIKPASRRIYLPKYIIPAIILLVLWLIISVIFKKYKIEEYFNRRKIFISILACNFSIFGFSSLFLYIFQLGYFSRLIVLGTFILPTIIEFVLGYIIYSIFKARPVPSVDEIAIAPLVPVEKEKFKRPDKPLYLPHTDIVDSIVELASENVYSYIADYIEITEPKTYVIATTTIFNIISLPGKTVNNIINLLEINDIRRINKFFEAVNRKIPVNGYFVSCVETQDSRKRRLTRKYPLIISYPYYLIDFIFKRVFPKVWGLKKLYFLITAGRNRVLSKAEVLGRLVSCGFQ